MPGRCSNESHDLRKDVISNARPAQAAGGRCPYLASGSQAAATTRDMILAHPIDIEELAKLGTPMVGAAVCCQSPRCAVCTVACRLPSLPCSPLLLPFMVGDMISDWVGCMPMSCLQAAASRSARTTPPAGRCPKQTSSWLPTGKPLCRRLITLACCRLQPQGP